MGADARESGDGARVMALSIHQPYATLLAMGRQVKVNETRSWRTNFRGTLLIHASRFTAPTRVSCIGADDRLIASGIRVPAGYPSGAFVGVGCIVACASTSGFFHAKPEHELDEAFGNWEPGRYAWTLNSVVAFPRPVSAIGRQGLWAPSEAEVAACREQTSIALQLRFPKGMPPVKESLLNQLFPTLSHAESRP